MTLIVQCDTCGLDIDLTDTNLTTNQAALLTVKCAPVIASDGAMTECVAP